MLNLLEKAYPIDLNYLTKSDLAGFSSRYALDFELIGSMSVANFLNFSKVGERRVERLISELDVKEHRAIDTHKIKSLLRSADTKSELFKATLRFWGVKKAQGSLSDEEFYAGVRHLLGSNDPAVRMELARLLLHHPVPIQSARVRKFYINFIAQVPATLPRRDRARRMSEELIRNLVETTRDAPSRQVDNFLRKLMREGDTRLSQVLADYRGDYEESLKSLATAQLRVGGESMPADEVDANKKCMSLFLSLSKRLHYLEI